VNKAIRGWDKEEKGIESDDQVLLPTSKSIETVAVLV
jgi:hypothetical protein